MDLFQGSDTIVLPFSKYHSNGNTTEYHNHTTRFLEAQPIPWYLKYHGIEQNTVFSIPIIPWYCIKYPGTYHDILGKYHMVLAIIAHFLMFFTSQLLEVSVSSAVHLRREDLLYLASLYATMQVYRLITA